MASSTWILACVFALAWTAVQATTLSGAELTAEEIVEAVKAADLSLRTIQGTFRTYSASIKAPGAIVGPDGLGLYSEYSWGWERDTARQYMYGQWGSESTGRQHYSGAWFAFDGEKLRTFSPDGNAGQIREVGPLFLNVRSPLALVGFDLSVNPHRNLPELLQGARLVSMPGTPAGVVVLTNDFKEGEYDLRLTAWIDMNRGFRPSQMEIRDKLKNTLEWQYENKLIEEVAPGVWLATKGIESSYYISDFQPPPGMSKHDLEVLGKEHKEQALALIPQINFQIKPLGISPITYVLDVKTLKINSPIPDEKFTFDFPRYALIWDDFQRKSYRVGGELPTAAPARGVGTYLVLANLVVAVIIVVSILMIRRMKRKLGALD